MTQLTHITVESALLGPDYEQSGPVTLRIADGLIDSIDIARDAPRLLAIPALADAHNHARPLSTTSFGAGMKPLETWLPRLAVMPSADPYTAAAAAFARSLAGGCTSVMVHLTRPSGRVSIAEEAREIARAAHDTGVSIGLAIAMRDRNPLIYGDHAALLSGLDSETRQLIENTWLRALPSVAQQLAWIDEAAAAVAGMPGHVDVQYGPTGVQWCTEELLQAVASASRANGRRVHMHLLETRPQRHWADSTYPDGIVSMLDQVGLLSTRLTLAHCVWADDHELGLIASSGARIAVNASSNLHLASGIARVQAMRDAGVPVALGLDGCALDEDDDALRELRLFRLLNGGQGFDVPGLSLPDALHCATVAGRAGLGLGQGGVLAVGMPADILVLDLAAMDWDALMPVPWLHYLFTRAGKAHIRQAFSRGRLVLDDGVPVGVDIQQLHTALRSDYRDHLGAMDPLIEAWPVIEAAMAAHYRGCC